MSDRAPCGVKVRMEEGMGRTVTYGMYGRQFFLRSYEKLEGMEM